MNSMHNSLSGSGGYSGTYPGYVPPPSALPYYNGYPAEVNQSANHYYSKPGSSVPPGYSSGMSPYSAPPINNSSMYYQQYGLGYQYSYGKYGLGSSLGYPTDISSGPGGVHPPSIGTLQSPSADLGLTGSMFSKNNKYSGSQGSSSPHSNATGANNHGSNVSIPNAPNTPSPGPHALAGNFRGPGVTPSPPVENIDGKKDLDKMKRCQVCGQVFRLMSECLAHMKTVHEAPLNVYNIQHGAGGHISQSMNSAHNLGASSSRHGSIGAPDSPLMALERMGWNEKQNISALQPSSPITHAYPSTQNAPHMPSVQHSHQVGSAYGSNPHSLGHPPSVSLQHSPVRHSSPIPTTGNAIAMSTSSNVNSLTTADIAADHELITSEESQTKSRRTNSYSMSSIIGETNDSIHEDKREVTEEYHVRDLVVESEAPDSAPEASNDVQYTNEPENLAKLSDEFRPKVKENDEYVETNLSQVQVSISEAVKESSSISPSEKDNTISQTQGPIEQQNDLNENETKKEFVSAPLIVGKKDLLREMQNTANKDEDVNVAESQTPNSDSNDVSIQEYTCSKGEKTSERAFNSPSEVFPEDLSGSGTNTSPKEEQQVQPQSNSQSLSTVHSHGSVQQRHPSPPVGMYPNQSRQMAYGNWPIGMSSGGFPGQYPYSQPINSQQPTKSQVYHAMQGRYPSQFNQGNPPPSNQFPPHGYMQNHPQGNWYPRGDSKAMWANWSNQGGQHFPQGYYGFPNANQSGQKHVQSAPPPAHIHPSPQASHIHGMSQKSSMHLPFPPNMNSYHTSLQHSPTRPTGSSSMSPHDYKESVSSSPGHVMSSSPGCVPNSPRLSQDHILVDQNQIKTDCCSESNVDNKMKKSGQKIGPKSKIMAANQLNQLDDLDAYKCTITVHENGSLNGYVSQGSAEIGGSHSCVSSDSEAELDVGPKFTTLKPAKRKYFTSKDGSFVGPKRIKLAKQVKERQEKRQRTLRELLRQSELEEQLQASRVEEATEQTGQLGNILLQSSILLCEKKVEVSSSVEECIASIKSVRQQSSFIDSLGDGDFGKLSSLPHGRKPGRRNHTKVYHNENSVIIQDHPASIQQQSSGKLRAKDFKWSHYIKSMRYWCKDCAHGFKNQREATMHMEEKCKINCLYMLECYVVVNDVQTHPQYGQKVQELLEEYQIDADHNCPTCGEIIARKADFLVHMDTHKDFMPWECTICGTRFKIRGSLKEHLRYTHMKGRVPCLKCNKVFPTSTLLRQHVKVHTQHYKYKSSKNREDELKTAIEATAGALEGTESLAITSDEGDKLSQEANEYRNWCKLMEMNALKNISSAPPAVVSGLEDEDSCEEGIPSADLSRSSSDSSKMEFNS